VKTYFNQHVKDYDTFVTILEANNLVPVVTDDTKTFADVMYNLSRNFRAVLAKENDNLINPYSKELTNLDVWRLDRWCDMYTMQYFKSGKLTISIW
jgi:hypothetical protein